MIRAKVCTAGALFLLGIMAISPVSFSQNLPANWEVKYLNLKDNLRALAIDPLDSKIVFIGSDLAVIGTTDGGELWTAGESFRTSSLAVSGAVGGEAMEILQMIEEADQPAAAEGGDGGGAGPALGEEDSEQALQEIEEQLEQVGTAAAGGAQAAEGLEAEAQHAREEAPAAEQRLAQAEAAAAAWQPDPISIADVDSLAYEDDFMVDDDFDKLKTWLEERGLAVGSDAKEMQDDLKNYLTAHEEAGRAVQEELAAAVLANTEAASRLSAVEGELGDAKAAEASAGEELEELEQAAESVTAVASEVPEAAEETAEEGAAEAAAEAEAEEEEQAAAAFQVTGVNYLAFDPAASEKIYLAAFDGVYRSGDTGATWEKIYTGPNPVQSAVICLAVDPSNPDIVLAGTLSGLARSSDGGKIWDRPAGRIANLVITRIAVHPFDSRIVFAGTAGYGIFKSTDGGGEWTQVFTRAGARANMVLEIEFAPSQPEVIYAGTMSGIYKSLDGGESWDLATGMGISPTMTVRDLIVSPLNPEQVVLAGDRGVFGTVNGGKLWRKLAFGTSFNRCKFLAFDPLDPATVWLMTSSRVFKSVPMGFLDLSGGQEMTLSGCCEFTIDGRARHSITIDNIDQETGEVTLTIQSDPRTVKIRVGESAAVDLTGDGADDLNLSLENLDGGAPLFRLVRIAPAAAEGAETPDLLLPPDQVTCLEDLEPYFRTEPTWVEVQQAASRWAEVHPEKIASWRQGASLRALLPRVIFDYREQTRQQDDIEQRETYSYSRDYQDQDRYEYETQDDVGVQFQTAYTAGVYELYRRDWENPGVGSRTNQNERDSWRWSTRSQENQWDRASTQKQRYISLRWHLGDFLYSRDQYNISVEARRLVELRQDVVEQVTLYYFDRRTARIDMILNPPADPFSRVEMLLQIQQLDASLDAMTGGYFSQTIREREGRARR